MKKEMKSLNKEQNIYVKHFYMVHKFKGRTTNGFMKWRIS
jgi:hypothetical protein